MLLICTPSLRGTMDINYVSSLLMSCAAFHQRRLPHAFDFMVGCGVDAARSKMASHLLKEKKFTHLLFIDDDMAWSADLPLRLLDVNVPIIGVPYRKKKASKEVYNVDHGEEAEYLMGHPHVISVNSLGTGMLLIKREVFETLADKVPVVMDEQVEDYHYFFSHNLVPKDGKNLLRSEDYSFCALARENGFKIWAYTDEEIAHMGTQAFKGNYAHAANIPESGVSGKEPMRLFVN